MTKRIYSSWVVLVLGIPWFGLTGAAQSTLPVADPSNLHQLQFRYLGPHGNRATAIVGDPDNPLVIYIGAASGGIFKTTDGGTQWKPIFDDQDVSAVGALAIAPSEPNTI